MNILQEPKYGINSDGELINRATGVAIPSDEPVFIFRAKDPLAVKALEFYASLVEKGPHREAVNFRVNQFVSYHLKSGNKIRTPDTSSLILTHFVLAESPELAISAPSNRYLESAEKAMHASLSENKLAYAVYSVFGASETTTFVKALKNHFTPSLTDHQVCFCIAKRQDDIAGGHAFKTPLDAVDSACEEGVTAFRVEWDGISKESIKNVSVVVDKDTASIDGYQMAFVTAESIYDLTIDTIHETMADAIQTAKDCHLNAYSFEWDGSNIDTALNLKLHYQEPYNVR